MPVALNITAANQTIEDRDFAGDVVVQEGVDGFTIRRCVIHDGELGLYMSAGPADPPITNFLAEDVVVHTMTRTGLHARNFRKATYRRCEVYGVKRPDGTTFHTDVLRTFAGGEDLLVEDCYLHDSAAIGAFHKDGAVRRAVYQRTRWARITAPYQTISMYDTADLSFRACDFGGASLNFTNCTNVYIDATSLATVLRNADGSPRINATGTTFVAVDPNPDPEADAQAILAGVGVTLAGPGSAVERLAAIRLLVG